MHVHDGHWLSPDIRDALAVAWQVIEGVEAVEVIDWDLGNRTRFCEPQIDRNPSFTLRQELLPSPVRNATACGTEVKLDRLATDIRLAWPGDLDSFVLEVIDPQDAIAATHSAVASRGTFRKNCVGPFPSDRAAVARAMKHQVLLQLGATQASDKPDSPPVRPERSS
jgi:hypothetical protein